jgi:PTH1 family peptidyl-tRNA hydrolase
MILLVGLGNIGSNYSNTRHNVGFMTIDRIAECYKTLFSSKNKFKADIAEISIESLKIFLVKPLTYMNLSGSSISSIISYYKINIKNLYIIHDDLDLPLAKVKYKFGGSSGGHNGLKSIDSHVGNEYHRIRIGIDRPLNSNLNPADYVLEAFKKNEKQKLDYSMDYLVQYINLLISGKLEEFKKNISSL